MRIAAGRTQQNLMRMDAVENLEGMIADYTDPEN